MTKGTKGWVMVTFTHPSLPYVFKVISDKSEKDTIHSRQQVMEKYRLVHEMDRAGRMLDALAFTNLEFQKDLFPKELLDELKQRAPSVIVEEGDRIIINDVEVHKVKPLSTVITHLYAQRKVTPLDFYLAYHIVAYYKLRIQESKDPEEIKAFEEMIQRILKDFTYYNSYLRDSVADSEEKERLQNSIQKARDDVLEEADKLAKESKDSRDVENEIRKVLIDFGLTIRDLAAAGIWVGDVKTKNYGVTQHGRVVSYDYDELDLLTSREFIENPPPYYPAPEDDWRDSNYWDKVVYRRVFLRDLESEMGIPLEYRDFFSRVHDYLFKEQYW
jgi:isocitrate dehydrogenase kinase/phosphatase